VVGPELANVGTAAAGGCVVVDGVAVDAGAGCVEDDEVQAAIAVAAAPAMKTRRARVRSGSSLPC